MARENVHILDDEMTENIYNMFNTKDEGSIRLALDIINNVDLRDKETCTRLQSLIHNSPYLRFAYFEDQLNNKLVISFSYDDSKLYVDSQILEDEKFYGKA